MGFLNNLKTKTLEKGMDMALDKLKDMVINPNIKDFGTVHSISYKNNVLFCTLTLLGLEHELLEVSCANVRIADDASSITLSDFKSNKPFIENALNQFVIKPIAIPDQPAVRTGIALLKKVLD